MSEERLTERGLELLIFINPYALSTSVRRLAVPFKALLSPANPGRRKPVPAAAKTILSSLFSPKKSRKLEKIIIYSADQQQQHQQQQQQQQQQTVLHSSK